MQAFVLFAIAAVTLGVYGVDEGWLPGQAKLLPEAVSACAFLLIVALGVRDRFRYVRSAYWMSFAAMGVIMAFGVLANGVDSGPVIAGLRTYVRCVPVFFLACVYPFNERQVRVQLLLLLSLATAQLPLAVYQKNKEVFFQNTSGDNIFGIFGPGGSGLLSIFLICAACIATAFYVRGRLAAMLWGGLLLVFLAPTAINETKATFILLPVGLFATFWAAAEPRRRVRSLGVALGALVVVGALTIPVYDYWANERPVAEGGGVSIFEFFTDERKFDEYVNYDRDQEGVLPGRGTAYRTALSDVLQDPVTTFLGFGLGNASESSFGERFTGAFGRKYATIKQTSTILFILEIGFLGLTMAALLSALCYQDSRIVADRDAGFWGALASGWSGAVAVLVVSGSYAELLASPAIAYLFWYLSGLIAARRMRSAAVGVRARP